MKPLNILIISGWKIFPTQAGGHLRSGSFAQALARIGHNVRIYSLAGRQDDYGKKQGYFEQQIETRLVEEIHCGWTLGLIQAIGRRLGYPRIWQHLLLEKGLVPQRLKQALQRADLIIYDLPYCPPIPGPWSDTPRCLLSHNLEHRLLAQGSEKERRWAAWMQKVESEARSRYQQILACAPEDEAYFLEQSGTAPVLLIPNGIDPRPYRRDPEARARVRAELGLQEKDWLIVFSGSRFEPNLEALTVLRAFCKSEASYLASRKIHFLVLGSMMPVAMKEGNLLATGRVESTFPYFSAADAALNPVVRGSGSNVKLFEYLAAQLPILSTGFGVRGTRLQEGHDFILAERANFIASLDQLLSQNRETWRAFAKEVWERQKTTADMEEIVRRTLKFP